MSNVEQHISDIVTQYLFESVDAVTFKKIKEDLESFHVDGSEFEVHKPTFMFNKGDQSLKVGGDIFNKTTGEKYGRLDMSIGK